MRAKECVTYHEANMKELQDMIALPELHEATLLWNLRARYERDDIYVRPWPALTPPCSPL